MNYGHRNYKQHPVIWDFPHITVGGSVKIGKGWSVDGEFEYERFRTDGKWDDDFGSDYNTNLLAVTKQFGLGQGSSPFRWESQTPVGQPLLSTTRSVSRR